MTELNFERSQMLRKYISALHQINIVKNKIYQLLHSEQILLLLTENIVLLTKYRQSPALNLLSCAQFVNPNLITNSAKCN